MTAPNTPAGDWEQAFAAYRRLRILRDADAAFGPLAQATYNREIAIQQAETRSGSRREALAQRAVKAASRAVFAAEERHHAQYGDPLERAAIAAVLAPASDLDAVDAKVGLICHFELDNNRDMPRPPMEIIEADLARLAAGSTLGVAGDVRPPIGTDQAASHIINADHLAEAISDIVDPGRAAPDLHRAASMLDLLQAELRRAVAAMGEGL